MLGIILVTILAVLIYFKIFAPYKYWERKGIPYVKPWPIFGNTASSVFRQRSLADWTQDMYNAFPDKRYVGIYQFRQPTLLIRDPELIKKITVKEFNSFPDHRPFASGSDTIATKNLFSLTVANGWQNTRATLSPAFTSSKMKMMFGIMLECAEHFTDYFQKQGGTVTVELKDTFSRFTNDIIATIAFGISSNSLKDRENDVYMMGKKLTDFAGIKALKFFAFTVSPTLIKLFNFTVFDKDVTQFFTSLIKQTLRVREEKQIVRPDMLHLLMEARRGRLKDENQSNVADSGFAVAEEAEIGQNRPKANLSDDDIVAQAVGFYFAGFDSTSTLMCHASYELALNPDVQEKLRQEIEATLEIYNGELTYEALLKMKYLDCVVSETLRKWPGGFTDRVCKKPFTIEAELPGEKPFLVEEGTTCWFPIYAIHRDPKNYPDPERFDPERFNDENKRSIKPFTYLPFGAGPRVCIGSRFALLESKMIIVKLLQKFEVVPVAKTQIPLKMSKKNIIPLPDGGLWLGFKPRTASS